MVWDSVLLGLTPAEATAQEASGTHRSGAGGPPGLKVSRCYSPVPGLSLASSQSAPWAGVWCLTLKREHSLLPLPIPVSTERPSDCLVSHFPCEAEAPKGVACKEWFHTIELSKCWFCVVVFLSWILANKLQATWCAAGRKVREEHAGRSLTSKRKAQKEREWGSEVGQGGKGGSLRWMHFSFCFCLFSNSSRCLTSYPARPLRPVMTISKCYCFGPLFFQSSLINVDPPCSTADSRRG